MNIQDFYRQDPEEFLKLPYESFDWYEVSLLEEKWTSWKETVKILTREKAITKGKGLSDYKIYSKHVPKERRRPFDPHTPELTRKCSRREWDSEVKNWKISVHLWVEANGHRK